MKKQMTYIFFLISILISSAVCLADQKVAPVTNIFDENTILPKSEEVLAESGDWIIKEVSINQGSNYVLFQKNAKTKKELIKGKDSNSIYSLIHDIKDSNLRLKLGKNALDRWIKNDGREEVQKTILGFEAMTGLQRDIYLQEKFELPKKYSLYLK